MKGVRRSNPRGGGGLVAPFLPPLRFSSTFLGSKLFGRGELRSNSLFLFFWGRLGLRSGLPFRRPVGKFLGPPITGNAVGLRSSPPVFFPFLWGGLAEAGRAG